MDGVKKKNMYSPYEMSVIMERMLAINTGIDVSDYGTGELFYPVEVHILSTIADKPGISVTELAKEWNRTKGAVSQILKKLEGKGLVYRQKDEQDKRKSYLFVTEAGKQLHRAHVNYDTRSYEKFFEELTKYYTKEQVWQTFEVLEKWIELSKEWYSSW